jgi:hypothetical protein
MKPLSISALAIALVAAAVGYFAGAGAPSARAGDYVAPYEYKVLSIIEFQVQGENIPGEKWVDPTPHDLPFKKIGDALLKDRVIMTKMLNNFAAEGWEPHMIYQNAIVVRRPAPK